VLLIFIESWLLDRQKTPSESASLADTPKE
jgi:hypothetical protein